jgi:photosystem II stability/assembly factor-like uncharacterized protein
MNTLLHLRTILCLAILIAFTHSNSLAQEPFWRTMGGAASTEPYTCIAIGPAGDMYLGTQGPGIFRSTDEGYSWDKDWDMDGWWAYAYHIYAPSADTVFVAASQGFMRSIDSGKHWSYMNEGISGGVNDLAPDALGNICVVNLRGVVSRTSTAGDSWTRVDSLPVSQASEIEIGPSGEIYVSTLKDGLFVSTTSGTSWKNLYAGENVALLYRAKDGSIFLTKAGVLYRTTDQGATLVDLHHGGDVSEIAQDSRNTIYTVGYNSGIRYLGEDGSWSDLSPGGGMLHLAISSEDDLYAITFGSVYRWSQPTTSGVSTTSQRAQSSFIRNSILYPSEASSMIIYNSLGAPCFEMDALSGTMESLDLTKLGLRSGVYFVKLASSKGVEVLKFSILE